MVRGSLYQVWIIDDRVPHARGVMITMRFVHAVAVVTLVCALASAQESLPGVDRFWPQVGELVPDFSLVNKFGERHDLESVIGPNGLLLAFNRSAD